MFNLSSTVGKVGKGADSGANILFLWKAGVLPNAIGGLLEVDDLADKAFLVEPLRTSASFQN